MLFPLTLSPLHHYPRVHTSYAHHFLSCVVCIRPVTERGRKRDGRPTPAKWGMRMKRKIERDLRVGCAIEEDMACRGETKRALYEHRSKRETLREKERWHAQCGYWFTVVAEATRRPWVELNWVRRLVSPKSTNCLSSSLSFSLYISFSTSSLLCYMPW